MTGAVVSSRKQQQGFLPWGFSSVSYPAATSRAELVDWHSLLLPEREEKEMRAGWSKNDFGLGRGCMQWACRASLIRMHWDRPISARQPRAGLSKHWHLSFAGLSLSQSMCTLTAVREVSDALAGCSKSPLVRLGLHGGSW